MQKTTALITGGSQGFGLELARQMARDGWQELLLVALYDHELATAKADLHASFSAIRIQTLACDLSEAGSAQRVYNWVSGLGLVPEVVINNAGFGTWGFFDDLDPARDHAMFRLNMLAVYDLTRLFAHDMIQRNSGRILNMCSTSSIVQAPLLGAYSATKGFVYNMTVAWDYELQRRGSAVRLIALCPPAARTGFQQAAHMQQSSLYRGFWSLDAPQVASEGYKALMFGTQGHIPGPLIGLFTKILVRLLPTKIKLAIVYDQTRPKT
jgi:uncharacterized protein